MSSTNTGETPKAQHQSRIPGWIVTVLVSGYPALFYALIASWEKRDDAIRQTVQIQKEWLEEQRRDNAEKGRDNAMLQRILYAQENFSKFLYYDSVIVANRRAAESRARADGNEERPN